MKNKFLIFLEIFKKMVIEEWRMHVDIFGKYRLVIYPLIIGMLFGILSYLSTNFFGIASEETVLLSTYFIIFVFGIQAGSLAFRERNTFENLIGEHTQVIYANRTMPLTPKIIISSFILKDLFLYMILFFIPISISISAALGDIALGFTVFGYSTAVFWLGLSITIFLASVSFKSKTGLGLILGVSLVVLYYLRVFKLIETTNSFLRFILILSISFVLSIVGIYLFNPPRKSSKETKVETTLSDLIYSNRLNIIDNNSLSVFLKTIYENKRSSSGLLKVFFSVFVIGLLSFLIIEILQLRIGIIPYHGLSVITILCMSLYSIYIWIHQIESISSYQIMPINVKEFTLGKLLSFYSLSIFSVLIIYTPYAIYHKTPIIHNILNIILLIGFINYYYGISYYFVGFVPFKAMFNSVVFIKFSVSLMAVSLPLLVVGISGKQFLDTPTLEVFIIVYSITLLSIGIILKKRADKKETL